MYSACIISSRAPYLSTYKRQSQQSTYITSRGNQSIRYRTPENSGCLRITQLQQLWQCLYAGAVERQAGVHRCSLDSYSVFLYSFLLVFFPFVSILCQELTLLRFFFFFLICVSLCQSVYPSVFFFSFSFFVMLYFSFRFFFLCVL